MSDLVFCKKCKWRKKILYGGSDYPGMDIFCNAPDNRIKERDAEEEWDAEKYTMQQKNKNNDCNWYEARPPEPPPPTLCEILFRKRK